MLSLLDWFCEEEIRSFALLPASDSNLSFQPLQTSDFSGEGSYLSFEPIFWREGSNLFLRTYRRTLEIFMEHVRSKYIWTGEIS